uniref:Aryl hydrocarbon receptor nuclear translocator homolog n=1 Tax=Panagrellus redivivus TaxID=6233 RepID=A0A7E4VXY4_PANRE
MASGSDNLGGLYLDPWQQQLMNVAAGLDDSKFARMDPSGQMDPNNMLDSNGHFADLGSATTGMYQQQQSGGPASSTSSGISDNKDRYARENHSEIERRRRNKMTHYINELAEMVPQCAALGRKPDKLTILRMAVTHMKSIRDASSQGHPSDPSNFKPTFLTDQELKHLILEAANGFLFVVSCDSGRVLYVADSIMPVLNLRQEDWMHRSIYDLIHPDDMDKVRDQLCGSEASLNRVLDLKSGAVKKEQGVRVHMSCRRGFICRMRLGMLEPMHRLRNRRPLFNHNGQNYVVVHCTGYIKNAPPAGIDAPQTSCLVAIGRLQIASMALGQDPLVPPLEQFSLRIAEDGKINFVDQRAAQLLGINVEQTILNRYVWQIVEPALEQSVRDGFQQMMAGQGTMQEPVRLRAASPDRLISCLLEAHKFLNPYHNQFEYVVGKVTVVDQQQFGNGNNAPANGNQQWQADPTLGGVGNDPVQPVMDFGAANPNVDDPWLGAPAGPGYGAGDDTWASNWGGPS